ncbi:hypothetical protein pipiens_007363 [Culex pipiens pipiens]|uniref:Uncharacterized protein n=1 Tax=Culex pipiens pipiens TaxID=38569 RepID=A0ABD1DNN1_CULPP
MARSSEEIKEILINFRNGTAPGPDGINIELLKNAPPEYLDELHNLLQEAWENNKLPPDLQETVQVPIPKKRAPKEVNDFRRITLCNVIYKILTMYMLKKVDEIAQELPSYQAAFLANRCAEDHIFTARRVMEEYWNQDKELASLGKTRRDFEHLLGNKQDLKKEVDRACLVPEQSDSEVSSASESNQSVSEESGHLNQSVRADSSEVEQSDNEEGILERGETGESDQSETDDSGEVNHSDESDSEGL